MADTVREHLRVVGGKGESETESGWWAECQ